MFHAVNLCMLTVICLNVNYVHIHTIKFVCLHHTILRPNFSQQLHGALSDRQNNLKTRVSSIINERGRFVRKSRSAGLPIQGRANNALVEVTLSAIAKRDAFKTMKDHGREALLYLGSDKPEMIEILKDYEENEFLDHKDRDITVDRKEAVAAMKAAQWRLQLEIKKDQKQREQLKLSQSKQVIPIYGWSNTK